MVGVGMFTSAGALLTAVAVKAQLTGAVTPADHIMRALASSSSASECAAEIGACAADPACVACGETFADQSGACEESVLPEVGDDPCGFAVERLCCTTDGCHDNAAYAAVLACGILAGDTGCGLIDISNCAGGGGSGSDSTAVLDDTSSIAGDRGITTDDSTTPMDDTSSSTVVPGVPTTDSTAVLDDDTSSTTTACAAEGAACAADPDCQACGQTLSEQADAVAAVCQGAGYDSETATCSEKAEVACCSAGEYPTCVNGPLLAALVDCLAAADGCNYSITDCTDGGDSSAPVGGDDDTTSIAGDRGVSTDDGTAVLDDTSSIAGDDGITTDNGTAVLDDTSSMADDGGITTADGTTAVDDYTSPTTTACAAEEAACTADPDCQACAQTLVEEEDTLEAACQGADYDSAEATCDEQSEVACCSLEEGPACLSGDLIVAWLDCIVAAEGCDFSIADCTDGGGSLPFLGGDDEADGIEADEDEEQEDADAANADADSATPFAVVGNSIGTILAAAVALAFMNAAA